MLTILDKVDIIANLFIIIDDLYKFVSSRELPRKSKAGVKAKLSISELITIAVIFTFTGQSNFKGFYRLFKYAHLFRQMPCYSVLLRNIKGASRYTMIMIQILTAMNSAASDGKIKIIDSMPLPVCNNKRIFNYSVTKLASRGKSSMGWFYEFKMHIVVDEEGKLLKMTITPGNVSDKDRKLVKDLFKGLKGLAIADAGYVSELLRKELKEMGVQFVTNVYKNMKKLMTQAQHKVMKLRQMVETVNGQIKYRGNCVSSLPRSFDGYMWRYITAVFTFMLLNQYF
jgi:hypothetical protein